MVLVTDNLAKMIGLIILTHNSGDSDFFFLEPLEHIKSSALELDAIIRDIIKQPIS